jgi:hypothetical protein
VIAARMVNNERARGGRSDQASSSSTNDISRGRRGGLRWHRGSGGRTRDQLYAGAKRPNIKGRSNMSKAHLDSAPGGPDSLRAGKWKADEPVLAQPG